MRDISTTNTRKSGVDAKAIAFFANAFIFAERNFK
jgi:hypothetical protein